jgi:hypothetical protein
MIYLLFILGFMVGHETYSRCLNSKIDIKAIARVAVAIRREKNKRYVEYVRSLPDCSVCGPGHRHLNFRPK